MPLVSSIVTSLVFVLSVLFYPNTSIVNLCVGGDFTLTCVTDTGTLVWSVGGYSRTYSKALPVNQPSSFGDHITVHATNVSSSNITSVANITGAPVALNGTVIQCRDNGGDSKEKHWLFQVNKKASKLGELSLFHQMVHCQLLT